MKFVNCILELGGHVLAHIKCIHNQIKDKSFTHGQLNYVNVLCGMEYDTSTGQKATIHQVTTMVTTSKNVLFPGHNYLPTTSTDDLTL